MRKEKVVSPSGMSIVMNQEGDYFCNTPYFNILNKIF
jgi:hypothetical protein